MPKLSDIFSQVKVASREDFVPQSMLPPLDYLHHKPESDSARAVQNLNFPTDYNPYRDPSFLKQMEVGDMASNMIDIGGLAALAGGGTKTLFDISKKKFSFLPALIAAAGGGTLLANRN